MANFRSLRLDNPVLVAAVGFVTAVTLVSACKKTEVVSEAPTGKRSSESILRQHKEISDWCEETRRELAAFNWKFEPCNGVLWHVGGHSVKGRPLVYARFGDSNAANTTLVFSTVHGDEITPVYVGLKLVNWMKDHAFDFPKSNVVIAPMVNPDGFFKKPKTRTNARGVDLNRNFATTDWKTAALKAWKTRFRSDPRRYPGAKPGSEPETTFQEELIRKLRPQKILSIHAPLNVMDYDGPNALSLAKFPRGYVRACLKLRKELKAVSTGFFPGSLGNYSGNEMGIPTLTLELPSANPTKAESYWGVFNRGIRSMIEFDLVDFRPRYASERTSPSPVAAKP